MSVLTFESLPDEARLWILALEAEPDPAQRGRLDAAMAELLGNWRHKGTAYQGAWRLEMGRLVLVAEPSMATQPSGCAIDGFFRRLHQRLEALGLKALEEDRVLVKLETGLQTFPKADLGAAIQQGTLGSDTPVVDLSLFSLGQYRVGGLLKPLRDTWIARSYRTLLAPAG